MPLGRSVIDARPETIERVDLPVAPPARRPGRTAPRARPLRSSIVILVALVVTGAVLRLWGLGAHRLGFDEAFTAMAGRKHVGDLLAYLRVRDSHPPLDYLVRAPLARAGVDELVFRLPSVVCSVGALALFAWWMRDRGLAGIVAVGLLAFSTFQLVHGREARMYAEMELLGVAAAVLADSWLRRPRRWHAPAIGLLTLVGLMTHVSMLLLGAGLLVLAGLRTDRDAWRWRVALGAGLLGWALLWGPSFLVQSGGGHSNWIPSTSLSGLVHTTSALVSPTRALDGLLIVAVGVGAALLWRADRRLGRVFAGCVLVPVALAGLAGLFEPVLLDRTLTVSSWGPSLALGYLVAGIARRSRIVGALAIGALALVMIPAAVNVVNAPSSVDRAVRHVEQVAKPGDVVASHSGGRLHLLLWSVGVRRHVAYRQVAMVGPGDTKGVVLGKGRATGRTWLLASTPLPPGSNLSRCAPDWSVGSLRVLCLRNEVDLGQAGTLPGKARGPSGPRSR